MGEIKFTFAVGKVSGPQIDSIKTTLDAQILAWNTQYPMFSFERSKITWSE